jgi:hypothetical protein
MGSLRSQVLADDDKHTNSFNGELIHLEPFGLIRGSIILLNP